MATRRELLAVAPAYLTSVSGCIDFTNEEITPRLDAVDLWNEWDRSVNADLKISSSDRVVFESSYTVPPGHREILVNDIDQPGDYIVTIELDNPSITKQLSIREYASKKKPCIFPIFRIYLGKLTSDVRTYQRCG